MLDSKKDTIRANILGTLQYERIGRMICALERNKYTGNKHAAHHLFVALLVEIEYNGGARKLTARALSELAEVTHGHVGKIADTLAELGLITIEHTGTGSHDTEIYRINDEAFGLPPVSVVLEKQTSCIDVGNKRIRVTTLIEEIDTE